MSYTQHLGVINKCIFDWFFFFLRKYLHWMNFMAFQYSSVWRGALTISRGWIISDLHLWLSRMNHCSRLRIFLFDDNHDYYDDYHDNDDNRNDDCSNADTDSARTEVSRCTTSGQICITTVITWWTVQLDR